MTVAMVDEPMADDKPKTLSVKLALDVIESARVVAALTGEPMTDILSDILRPIIFKREQEELAKRTKAPKGRGPKS